ncbi:MAG TPA: hypothetical protein VFA33_07685 [Bryobacteraceae bacterium]|nr:hypothetical protein [Bryobacteraceae bacterium]
MQAQVRLYRFYNYAANRGQGRYGEPFALCDRCVERQPVPAHCQLYRLADQALMPCHKCGARNVQAASAPAG